MLHLIVAVDLNYGIGRSGQNRLPWRISEDLAHFKRVTTRKDPPSALIMGRKTADEFSEPLPSRANYVLTSQAGYRIEEGFRPKASLLEAVGEIVSNRQLGDPFAIGGVRVIEECLQLGNLLGTVYLTRIGRDYGCDLVCDSLSDFLERHCQLVSTRTEEHLDQLLGEKVPVEWSEYRLKPSSLGEQSYLNVMRQLIDTTPRATRNALTRGRFGASLEFDLRDGFPALTTKRLFWKGVVNELLFFLGGCTDNQWLQDRGVHIWDGNTAPEFLAKTGLDYPEGTLGPVYGYQWRHYNLDYRGKEVRPDPDPSRDQLAEVIDLLLNDPSSRRILLTTYNYSQVKKGVLPPCHGLVCQFYVDLDGRVDCQMYQRSADWFLGVPFNIASYALLLHIIVNHLNHRRGRTEYSVGRLLMTFGDHHLYENHLLPALTQLGRFPKELPRLDILKPIASIEPDHFLSLPDSNFQLSGYMPDKPIRADMVA
jgi:dihydrofolate reductase/thymidylate synthase